MLTIDGSFGEGGGQILRSSLALSMLTGTPFRIENIRAGRRKPGLMRQHLTGVQAAARICGGAVEGDAIGSQKVTFHPGPVQAGEYTFSIGTAGSTTLVLQAVLPVLLTAGRPSRLTLEGGTHNPMAPPFPFLERVYVPLVNRMGPTVTVTLDQPGFYPAGGGRFTVDILPAEHLTGLELIRGGDITDRCATALIAQLDDHIAERELKRLGRRLGWDEDELLFQRVKNSRGPGNIVFIEAARGDVTEVFTGFGERGVRAEGVVEQALKQYFRWLEADVPVGEYLADQLLLPLAIAGQGQFLTLPLSKHSTTHIELIRRFLDVSVTVEETARDQRLVTVGS